MSDLNFDPPETHGVDYSERTDPDSGGGMNFVFYDQGQPGKNGQEKKKRPPADFGNPVRVKLSSQSADDDDSDDDDEDASPAEDSTAPEFSLDMAASAPSAPKEDDEDEADEEDTDDPVQVSLSSQATQPPPPSVTGQHLNITV